MIQVRIRYLHLDEYDNFLPWMYENVRQRPFDWNWSAINFTEKGVNPSVDITDSSKAVLVALRWGGK